jgi:Flp pilus assembly protein TadD
MDPSEPGYHQDLALVVSHAGRFDEASRESNAAIALAPHDATLNEFGGLLALHRGHYEDALSMIANAVSSAVSTPIPNSEEFAEERCTHLD